MPFSVWIVAALLFTSCTAEDRVSFESAQQALTAYHKFLDEVQGDEVKSGDELANLCKTWHARRDSVIVAIDRDHSIDYEVTMEDFFAVNDSIGVVLSDKVSKVPVTFVDMLNIRKALSDVVISEKERPIIDKYAQFFASLDNDAVRMIGKSAIIRNYEALLSNSERKGFSGKADILAYVKAEDRMFRTFLLHLSMMHDTSVTGIQAKTADICKAIYDRAASSDQPGDSLSRTETVILLTMRSNRRLLQNAETCATDINKHKISDANQSVAYLWMLVQPFFAIDDFSMALLSPKESNSLSKLADELPDLTGKLLLNTNLPIDINKLPEQLCKAAIHGNH
jgi:hypothetical protein